MTPRLRRGASLVFALVLLTLAAGATHAGAAPSRVLIEGSGSSWASNALNVWIAGVKQNSLKVVFTSTGSAQGRKDFGNETTDFGVSDIGYQGKDPQTNDTDLPCKLGSTTDCRDYAYLPIVAGGTSFPYHLEVAGKLVRNLRLSGTTLAKIFTGGITNWNDKAITRDNNGRRFPSIPIIPISHAEGSGSSAQFTAYLDQQYPSIYRPFVGGPGETEYFKPPPNGKKQTGSDGVINFITSSAANGSIGYDEYSYALAKNYPVAKIENAAGYYTLPTQFNVAVALQRAKINENKASKDYLLQDLRSVYTFNDPRTYVLSSYSYMIIPTAKDDSRMSTGKRQTLADFIYYSVCQGQAQVGPVGYSSLPLNLVQASFNQVAKLKQADPKVDLTRRDVTACNNPTFVKGNLRANHLAQIAPKPAPCDRDGAGPCTGSGDSGTSGRPGRSDAGSSGSGGSGGAGGSGGSGGSSGGGAGGSATGTGGTAGGAAGAAGAGVTTRVNPDTGQVETVAAAGTSGDGSGGDVTGVPTDLASARPESMTDVLGPLAALEVLVVLILPPVLYYLVLRRRGSTS